MEEIQKSIQLINFSDSIFDGENKKFKAEKSVTETETEMLSSVSFIKYLLEKTIKLADVDYVDVDSVDTVDTVDTVDSNLVDEVNNSILGLGKRKHVQFEELLFNYFNEYEKGEEILMEILVTYSPFVVSKEKFEQMIKREIERVKEIELKRFGNSFCEYKLINLLNFNMKIFSNNEKKFDFEVLSKTMSRQLLLVFKGKRFDAKGLAKTISLVEAAEYSKLNFYDFYKKNSIGNFIFIFNKFTNFLISEILSAEIGRERKLIVKRILKLAKELSKIGAMNSLKGCIAAIESNPIHRLKLIKDQTTKYQERFKEFSALTSSEKNFKVMRGRACLVPWLGIILRDFTFIKELIHKTPGTGLLNVPLALCLRKLLNSMAAAREACEQFLKGSQEEELKKAAVMGKWLETVDILYESEESQYARSIKISHQ